MSAWTGRRSAALLMGAALLTGAIAAPPAALAATTITVNTLTDVANATDGKCSLREALTAVDTNTASGGVAGECPAGTAGDGDVIVFSGSGTITLGSQLAEMNEGFTLDGGSDITISGNAKQFRVFILNGGSTTLRRLTITQCRGNYGGAILSYGTLLVEDATFSSCNGDIEGGAINNQAGTVTIRRSTFTGNAANTGGAVSNAGGGTMHIESSSFSDNLGVATAGAIFNTGPLTITGSTFYGDNHAPSGGAIVNTDIAEITGSTLSGNRSTAAGGPSTNGGGAILNEGGLTITASHVDSNQSASEGGGIKNAGTLLVVTSSVSSNVAATYGGGIVSAGPMTIDRSTLDGNTGGWGGAVYPNGSTTIKGSTLSANHANYQGGAMQLGGDLPIRIINSTLAGNTASQDGGAISVIGQSPDITITNATITGNQAQTAYGGIGNASKFLTVTNTIVAGNTAPSNAQVANSTGFVTSIVQDSTTGILSSAGLANNGGPTKTVTLVKSASNPAIDGGTSAACAADPVSGKDQRGVTRPTACDIGAVELESTAPSASGPKPQLRSGTTLSGTSERVKMAWTPSDPGGSGVKRYIVARSVNGGSWTTLTSSLTTASLNQTLSKDTSYRYRVKPVDYDGNVGAWAYGPTFTPRLVQQSSSAITYGKTWTTSSSTSFSGGSVKYAKVTGASASYTFTGRSIAFVTTRDTNRGSVIVYITDANGTTATPISLNGTRTYRYVAFAKSWSSSGTRKIRIVTQSSARVDLDAFAVIK